MGNPTPFEQALKAGTPEAALALLQADVRTQPGKAELRVALFQLHCILGRWDKALSQLDVAGQLDAGALAMVQTYREAIACERLRSEVFAGRRVPMIFGEPEPWLAMLVEALLPGRGAARPRLPRACGPRPSRLPRRMPARWTAAPSTGWPTLTAGWARCWRPSSTAATTGCRSRT